MDETLESLTEKLTLDDSLSDSNILADNDVENKRQKRGQHCENTVDGKNKEECDEGEQQIWKWWEEKETCTGLWKTLKHNGPAFPPPYTPFRFLYNGKEIMLSPEAEEVAVLYARTLDHAYTDKETKRRFNEIFFKEWQSVMNDDEKNEIKEFKNCDFSKMHAFLQYIQPNKLLKAQEQENHGYCFVNGHKIKVQNFRIQAPEICQPTDKKSETLGALRRRVRPEDVRINCSEENIPAPPPGHKWKEPIEHDNTANWLASWKNNLNTAPYMKFHENSPIQGKKDYKKFEVARKLSNKIDEIRKEYKNDWMLPKENEDLKERRQRAIVLFLIDELALRVGNKSEDTDYVGICTLEVQHIKLDHDEQDENNKYYVSLNFESKSSIEYSNKIPVDELVYKNLQDFISKKSKTERVFDKLTSQKLNEYLDSKQNGLRTRVFRTYHASKVFEDKLYAIPKQASTSEKIQFYKKATDDVANLCNHVRAPRKTKATKQKATQQPDTPKKYVPGVGTTQKYYNDPRITAAWCGEYGIRVEDVFLKDELEKFIWAIEMVKKEPNFKFSSK